jgi:DNA-binding CsgD family transcriptional regulator/PAS domain-containing protein
MTEAEEAQAAYYALVTQQKLNEADLDYAIWEGQKPMLQQLAQLGNNGITVFDFNKKQHIFTSYSFSTLFGYNLAEIERDGNNYFDSKIHPEDYVRLMQYGVAAMRFFLNLPIAERKDYKGISEYRILNADGKYVRIVEQHQVLELDKYGNVWLVLSVLDISPDQENYEGIKSQLLNFRTGKLLPVSSETNKGVELSERQIEILQLVKDGLFSKEISDRLSISVHTVNTHRQRILEKLGVDSSIEAANYATKLGLIE